jgi:hypothetical protein
MVIAFPGPVTSYTTSTGAPGSLVPDGPNLVSAVVPDEVTLLSLEVVNGPLAVVLDKDVVINAAINSPTAITAPANNGKR